MVTIKINERSIFLFLYKIYMYVGIVLIFASTGFQPAI
jgi:hypothetical protein